MTLDDEDIARGVVSSVCLFCRHFNELYKCAAFEIIPLEIWQGENDHRQPYSGDNGIQYEPIEDTDNG